MKSPIDFRLAATEHLSKFPHRVTTVEMPKLIDRWQDKLSQITLRLIVVL